MHTFLQFLDTGVTSIHVARRIEQALMETGGKALPSDDGPSFRGSGDRFPQPGDMVVHRCDGTVYALRYGTAGAARAGMVILAAHTDSPGLQLKHRAVQTGDSMVRIPVEVYGGPILATWLDRDLAIAGRVGTPSGVHELFIPRPLGVIPNLAIHLNREVNEKLTYNRQDHLQFLAGPFQEPQTSWLMDTVGEYLGIDPGDILDAELHLVSRETAAATPSGMICSPRLDNLAGCYTILEAFRQAPAAPHTQVAVWYDHEEIGSTTAFGAASAGLEQFLRRALGMHRNGESASLEEVLPRTVLLSNDAAHARHPNYPDRHDGGYAPVLRGGPVIKKSAVRRYASELPVTTWFHQCCVTAGVPVQYLQNRSDLAAGSTIGPAVASRLAIRSADIGIPLLAMHSIRETAAWEDVQFLTAALTQTLTGDLRVVTDPDTPR